MHVKKVTHMQAEKISRKYGMSPGSLVYTGDKHTHAPVTITLIDYSPDHLTEETDISLEACESYIRGHSVTWINIIGVHNPEIIERIGLAFHLHPLSLEDVLNTGGRPKLDDYEDYLFIVLKMIDRSADAGKIEHEHVCLIIREGLVISFQEHAGDVFGPVRQRIRKGKGRIRKSGADYLAYALMDMIVDHYFLVLEGFGEEMDTIQDAVLSNPEPLVLDTVHTLRRELIYIRKSVWPVREIVASMLRLESPLISRETQIYLRDVYDHTVQVAETVEMFREVLSSALDIYLSSVNNRMSGVMKVLTVIATIFIPLTFIAGVYGMNFVHMPELEWRYAYPAVWGIFILAAGGMVAWFRYRKWL